MRPGAYRESEVLARLQDRGVADLVAKGARLALTAQPMTGVTRRPDLSQRFADAYADLNDDVGTHYASQLRSGQCVPVFPHEGPDRVWAPGELFMRS
jgi:hypothetical protein